ncbi:hypothetical protein ACFQFG_15860 [Methylobacterium persicinum]
MIKDVFASINKSRRTAPDGPTFEHLKYLYPGIEDRYLKEAIKQAVSFDMACVANFHYNSDSYIDDCKIAVAFAAAENPGFSAKTIAIAEHYLMISMR